MYLFLENQLLEFHTIWQENALENKLVDYRKNLKGNSK